MSAPRPQTHRFSVADFYRMAEAGILRDDQRVELIDGEIKDMMPIGEFHATVVDILNGLFGDQRRLRFQLRIQNPLQLDDHGMVQPDVMLLHLRDDCYRTAAPRPHELYLLVEVADTSLSFDQHEKLPRYARAGISEVWIVNVPDRQVEVYREPAGLTYNSVSVLKSGQSASPASFRDILIPVAELFS
jgi:Uma2 family endonuclease